ncbi:FecR family protein [Chitinophaga sp. Ak27]|uniref:FecR family protein n=1 Tax=Chitinophaga sp. Ak27 TaxID=2726116 RepID=UPI00145FA14A|nr:FecR family protein [Chitinophaga sp. Ak27]NLU94877.1 DUF4974 domain-containing protein [Chitinophaga sp. Ak27]
MEKEEVQDLLRRYREGTCTEHEIILLEKWYAEIAQNEQLPDEQIDLQAYQSRDYDRLKAIEQRLRPSVVKPIRSRRMISIAASLLALFTIAGAAYWIQYQKHSGSSPQKALEENGPGGLTTVLTLSNGQKIKLDEKGQKELAKDAGLLVQMNNGKVIYKVSDDLPVSATADQMNTITTPKGERYELILQDGTKIWLNADSKLTFPVSFNGRKQREVFLSGEAYLEVAKNPRKPFLLKSNEQVVTVTGTHFNVRCYLNEPIQTTLAEGGVTVSQTQTGKTAKLTPGRQSIVTIDGILIKEVDPDDYIAWKLDYFVFVQTPMKQVLTEIGRWYNVQIDESKIPSESFDGRISRRLPLSEVLHLLELNTDHKFKVVERRITIQ